MKNTWIFNKENIFQIVFLNFLSFLFIFPIYADECQYAFTRLVAERKFIEKSYEHLDPTHSNFFEDRNRVLQWGTRRNHTPNLLKLPKGVHYIHQRLEYSPRPYLVRLEEGLNMVGIARAHYTYNNIPFSTDVVFGKNVFRDHLSGNKQWLISPHAKAAVLMLHGGGTRTTGSSVFAANLAHFIRSGIEGLSIDLPMHARGSRNVLSSFREEILAIGAFAKKYIPPHVPLFVYGHSWGAVFADELMRMTGEYKDADFFHPALKGVIITSPAVDAAPGGSVEEKVNNYVEHNHKAKSLAEEQAPEPEQRIWSDMIRNGKLSLLGGIFLSTTLAQIDQVVPDHKGKNYVPGLMVVGTGDPLVYLGFEDLFHNYYDQLQNVETHYLESLHYAHSDTEEPIKVGHLLTDYQFSKEIKTPVNLELAVRFIARQLGTTPAHLVEETRRWTQNTPNYVDDIASIQQLYSNNLAFREFVRNYNAHRIDHESVFMKELNDQMTEEREAITHLMRDNLPKNQLLAILRQIAVAPSSFSKRDLRSVQEKMASLTLPKNIQSFSLFESLLLTDSVKEAEGLARELLGKFFLQLSASTIINAVEGEVAKNKRNKSNQEIKEERERLFMETVDSFPFKSGQVIPVDSEFSLSPLEKEHLISLYRIYNESQSQWVRGKIMKEINQIINTYDLDRVLYRALISLSKVSKPLRKYHKQLREYLDKLSQFLDYNSDLARDLRSLIKQKSDSAIVQHAVSIVRNHPVLPLEVAYSLFRLEPLMADENFTEDNLISYLEQFQLPKDIQDQIVNMKQTVNKGDVFFAVKKLIVAHSPASVHYDLIQTLREMTSAHTLERYIETFPSALDDKLREVLSGKLSPYSVIRDRYYSNSGVEKTIAQLSKVFQGHGNIRTLLDLQPLDKDVKEQILIHYNKHMEIEGFIDRDRIPTVQDFAESKGMTKEDLTQEQLEEYSEKIKKIENNVETVQQLQLRALSLFNEKKGLLKKVRKSINKVRHNIRLVRDAFHQVLVNPPESMRKRYSNLSNDFEHVEELASEWSDLLDKSSLDLLSDGKVMSEKNFEILLLSNEVESANERFEEKFALWKNKFQKFLRDVISPIISGEMGIQFQKAFQSIYGSSPDFDLGIRIRSDYSQLEDDLSKIAIIEEDLFDINEELATLAVEYNVLHPNKMLVIKRSIQPLQVLNPTLGTTARASSQSEYIHRHRTSFRDILMRWHDMEGTLPPALPDLH
ncbi:MAG: alpha/beta fold hydrolase [Bdellovibrionales bacterium]|nr:alpha/beta fold hydrolase [Bdellovibrionales bacterium]